MNWLKNGDGETGPCSVGDPPMAPTDWDYNGTITQVTYNNNTVHSLMITDQGPRQYIKDKIFV